MRSPVTGRDRSRRHPLQGAGAIVIVKILRKAWFGWWYLECVMRDRIFESFLFKQLDEGLALAAESDIVDLLPLGGPPPQHYIANFHCRGFACSRDGEVREWRDFSVGIYFPPTYLRRADPFVMLRWFAPPTEQHPDIVVWHPNIALIAPLICIGRIAPGTPLKDLLHQLYEVISYQKYTPNEFDSLNKHCCAWARANVHLFPADRRPLKRKTLDPGPVKP